MRRAGLARRPLLSSSFSRKAFMSTSSMPQTIMRVPASDSGRRDRRGVALAIVLCAQLMIILDLTVVNIALPSIAHGLHFSAPSLSWVLIAYTLTFGGLLLLGSRSGDILDRRRVFMAGIALFTAASLAGGLANSAGWLLAARAVQGAGGAIASPAVLALITASFAEGRERTRALGLYTAVAMGGASLGLVLGGIITEWASWRWVLFVNVPIGAVVLLTAPRFLSESPRQPGHFDIAGALTSIAGMAALVYAFIRAASSGWRDPLTLSAFGAAAVLLGLFLLTETRARQPITPLRLFADRGRSGSYLARPDLPGDRLPARRPAADAAARRRHGRGVRAADHGFAGRGAAGGLRRRVQHGERHAAGRRLTRPGHPGHRVLLGDTERKRLGQRAGAGPGGRDARHGYRVRRSDRL